MSGEERDLKTLTARSLKWNLIDRLSSQALYAITGIVLARLLSHDDFGLVGAVLVFYAFASLFVDSGFQAALIQRKSPSQLDYSTVFWFNISMAIFAYIVLWFAAPLIAEWFQGDRRLIPLSRVMFLSFIISATSLVQVNRLMKQMDVKMIAIANTAGLALGGVVGICLAVAGYGAWAMVWQNIILDSTRAVLLWSTTGWKPLARFSWQSFRSVFSVGSGVLATSFLNKLFQNIYSFFIGNRVGLTALGYYTQADKWSKMGIMTLSQAFTASFLPLLSAVQDDEERFPRVSAKTNRFTGYATMPAMGFLIVMATPIFHILFGEKWDASIVLFQLLLLRGVFTVLTSLYNNYIIALGKVKMIVYMELLRDGVAFGTLILTLPFIGMTISGDVVYGIKILLWGQVLASAVTWIATLAWVSPLTGRSFWRYLSDYLPYTAETAVAMAVMWMLSLVITNAWLLVISQCAVALIIYLGVNYLMGSAIQKDVISYLGRRFIGKNKTLDQA